jgi:hypothetical protein
MAPQAGWYRDPEGTAPYRWWDGECWTAWQSTARTGFPPPGPIERVQAVRRRPWSRTASIVTVVIAVLVGAATVYGWRLRDQDRAAAIAALPSALGSPAQDPLTGTLVTLDAQTGLARVTTISSIVLPHGWTSTATQSTTATWAAYALSYDPSTPGFTSSATWRPATVAYGLLQTEATVAGDMRATAASTSASLAVSLFGSVSSVTQSAITTRPVTGYESRLAGEATSTISFVADGTPMSATVTVLTVQQSVRAIVCVVVIEPQQATAAQKQRMADARASLWVR